MKTLIPKEAKRALSAKTLAISSAVATAASKIYFLSNMSKTMEGIYLCMCEQHRLIRHEITEADFARLVDSELKSRHGMEIRQIVDLAEISRLSAFLVGSLDSSEDIEAVSHTVRRWVDTAISVHGNESSLDAMEMMRNQAKMEMALMDCEVRESMNRLPFSMLANRAFLLAAAATIQLRKTQDHR